MLSAARLLLSPGAPILRTASRGTVIVERWYEVPLAKLGEEPNPHPRRHRIFRLVEDTKHRKKEKMELILTQAVHKLGGRGDTVMVEKALGRNKLLPEGLAVYPSPENKAMFQEEKKKQESLAPSDRLQTWTGQMTVELLKKSRLEIRIPLESGWTLSPEVVARNFLRNLGVVVPPAAVKLPEEPITTFGEYWCEVTVNGIDAVRLPLAVAEFVRPRSKRYRRWFALYGAAAERSDGEPPAGGSEAPPS